MLQVVFRSEIIDNALDTLWALRMVSTALVFQTEWVVKDPCLM
jgi:hypothetical protein